MLPSYPERDSSRHLTSSVTTCQLVRKLHAATTGHVHHGAGRIQSDELFSNLYHDFIGKKDLYLDIAVTGPMVIFDQGEDPRARPLGESITAVDPPHAV